MKLTAQNFSKLCFWTTLLLSLITSVAPFEPLSKEARIAWRLFGLLLTLGFWSPLLYNWLRRRSEGEDKALFLQEFADLLNLGLTESEALQLLAKERKHSLGHRFSSFYPVAQELNERMLQGDSLQEAFENTSGIPEGWNGLFSYCQDETSLQDLLRNLSQAERTRLQLPLLSVIRFFVLVVLLMGTTFFLTSYTLPTFEDLFEGQGQALPWGTQVLLGIRENWFLLVFCALSYLLLQASFLAIPFLWMRRALWNTAFYLPGFRKVVSLTNQTRVLQTLAAAYTAGAPQFAALKAASEASTVRAFRKHLKRASESLGETLSSLLAEKPSHYSPETLWLIEQGESFENLPSALKACGESLAIQQESATKKLVSRLDVALLLALGVLVLFTVVYTMLPIMLTVEASYR